MSTCPAAGGVKTTGTVGGAGVAVGGSGMRVGARGVGSGGVGGRGVRVEDKALAEGGKVAGRAVGVGAAGPVGPAPQPLSSNSRTVVYSKRKPRLVRVSIVSSCAVRV
jgi:hypothetical protein